MALPRTLGSGPCDDPVLQRRGVAGSADTCSGSPGTGEAAGPEPWLCVSRTSLYHSALFKKVELGSWWQKGSGGQLLTLYFCLFEVPSFSFHGSSLEGQFPFSPVHLRGQQTDICQQSCAGLCWRWGPGPRRPHAQREEGCWSRFLRGPTSEFWRHHVELVPGPAQR